VVVVSHTYVEPENRGKLRALAAGGRVTAVIPTRWRQTSLGSEWRLDAPVIDAGVQLLPVPWRGPAKPSFGGMRVPGGAVPADAVVQIEEEPWTPTAYFAVRRRLGAATVLFTWENVDRRFPFPWSAMRRAVFRRIAGLIAGSSGAAEVARAQGYRGPVAVIPQLGIDPPAQVTRSQSDTLRLAYVGRLVPEKGVDLLLLAASILKTPWRLTILGDGPERPALEALAATLGLGEQVRFLGARLHHEVAAIWPDTDALILPSRSTPRWKEQLGHVLLEAMAHGVATAGSTCGAIPEVIGNAGLLFAEGSAESLAETLRMLALGPESLGRLGEAGRRRVADHFTNLRIAARTLMFHQEVLSTR
jgi:hypothetical protein